MADSELAKYQQFVRHKLDELLPIFDAAARGDFSKNVQIPNKEDEFRELYKGIQVILDVVRQKIAELERLNADLLGKVRERTEALEAQAKALEYSEARIKEVINSATNLFYSHTPDHALTYLSPQSQQFLGLPPEEAKKKWQFFLTDNPINQKGIQVTEEAIKTGKRQPPYELELRKADGKKIWVLVNEQPIIKNGKTISIVGALTDITARRQAEEALAIRTQELEQINHLMVGRELKMVELKRRLASKEGGQV